MAQFDRRNYIIRRGDLQVIDLRMTNVSMNVVVGASLTVEIYAPANSYCETEVSYFVFYKPTGAASGTHKVVVTVGASRMEGVSNYNDNIILEKGYWEMATSSKKPSTEETQLMQSKGILFSDSVPLKLIYTNNTNVNNTNTYTYVFICRKQVI